MHDIICPKCGEKYIARDVAFDISEFVTELLYDSQDGNREAVQDVKFKYYIDEETIETNHIGDSAQLYCTMAAGPMGDWNWYRCRITPKTIWEYIQEKCNMAYTFDIATLIDSLHSKMQTSGTERNKARRKTQETQNDAMGGDTNALLNDVANVGTSTVILDIEKKNFILACRLFFEHESFYMDLDKNGQISSRALSNFRNDSAVKVAIQIFKHLKDCSFLPDSSVTEVTLQVAIFSKQEVYQSKYSIPDTLFIRSEELIRKNKICRYCGYRLPDEFGYYPIKPIVVLGSHNAGKTSFLASLSNTITTTAPFCSDYYGNSSDLLCSTLMGDEDVKLWKEQVKRFTNGLPMEKTSLDRQPVLNIKVKTPNQDDKYTIYSFADWAGEVFISNDPHAVKFDPLRYQKLFRWTRHLLMFLEPTQIDHRIPANKGKEENVDFKILDLVDSLKEHLNDLIGGKFSSLTYILCQADRFGKSDRFDGLPQAANMLAAMERTPESVIYSNGKWDSSALMSLQEETVKFLQTTNISILTGLKDALTVMGSKTKVALNYIPVAPYGQDVGDRMDDHTFGENHIGMARSVQTIQSRCVGIPFLVCLHKDGII